MALCNSCSAPLPVNTSFCDYCGTRNDLDVLAMHRFTAGREVSELTCPDCGVRLESLRLCTDGSFVIERCPSCFGLFFDPGEVQAYLEQAVASAYEIRYAEIVSISRERANKDRKVRYIKCPQCKTLMNRVNFGSGSGVIMDVCKEHGVWLDNGELIQLMEWKRAGGQLMADHKENVRTAVAPSPRSSLPIFPGDAADDSDRDLLTAVLDRLFCR